MSAPHDPGFDLELRADCSRCFALCCVAPAFARSADFAIDKPGRDACPNLAADSGCSIHSQLRPRGFAGCTSYDCFGAGQHVAQVTFGGRDWRESPAVASSMFEVFPVMRALHELLWYLTEADSLLAATSLRDEVRTALLRIRRLTAAPADELAVLTVAAVFDEANRLLSAVSDVVRADGPGRGPDRRGADLSQRRVEGRRSPGCQSARCSPDRCGSASRRPSARRCDRRGRQSGGPARR